MANNELKPCPFCGAHLPHMWSLTLDGQEHSITCTECPGRAVFKSSTREQAIAAWNRRNTPAQAEPSGALPELPKPWQERLKAAMHPGMYDSMGGEDACRVLAEPHMQAEITELRAYAKQAIEARILGQQGGGDAALLDWIEANPERSLCYHKRHWSVRDGLAERDCFKTVREAIRAAVHAQAGDVQPL